MLRHNVKVSRPAARPAGPRPTSAPARRSTSPVRHRTSATALAAAVLLAASPALAGTSGGTPMPWEGPMDQMLAFFTGPFVRVAAILAIVLLGLGMAFSENGTGTRKLVSGFFGVSLAFGAATWGLQFFGFNGGACIPLPDNAVAAEIAHDHAPDAGTVVVGDVTAAAPAEVAS